ncbi:MAG: TonB-dependent receptor [Bacteroidota bacterium]|jgi:outer membrane receptor protein involved in Fe transport
MNKTVTLLFFLIFPIYLFAGTTGKIAGTVTDAKTGDPLPGVNVIVVGTTFGGVTDFDGNYTIINLSPGTYTIKVSAIGYSSITVSNLKVNIELTTRQDFKISEETIQLQNDVVIVAERPLVQKDLTATTAVVGGDDIKQLPVTEIGQVIGLQAGNVDGKIRGGRSGEVAYWIDGVPVTDVFNGSSVVDVNPSMVQELQVLSGAFNAEYGQAMSGIVNIATREGTDKFGGSITTYAGDFLSNRGNVFKGIQKFEPLNIRDIEGSLSGPIVPGTVSFFVNARNIYYGGYLNGIRKFNPSSSSAILDNQSLYILGSNAHQDSLNVYSIMQGGATATSSQLNITTISPFVTLRDSADSAAYGLYNDFYKSRIGQGPGDGKSVPMNWNKKLYLQGKISTKISSVMKLNLTGILDDVESMPYDRAYQYNPDGKGHDYSKGYTTILQLTHTLSNQTFYTLGASFFEKSFMHYLYENPYDTRYVHPSLSTTINTYSFLNAGNDLNRYYRMTTTGLAKFDISSQVTNEHYVKAGIEARQHRVFEENINLVPIESQSGYTAFVSNQFINTQILPDTTTSHDRYVHHPVEFSTYLQDKMEFKDLIINIGVRFDYFDPDGNVLSDPEDPWIYAPVKPSNIFFDYNGNGVQDPNEQTKTIAQRQAYWYKKASPKFQFSPRFGASFPVTDRGVFHFSYGHFLQIPNFSLLYANPLFKVGSGTGNVDINSSPTGNADLKPEQTINAEVGLQQQLSDDLSLDFTAYIRDIRNLAGTRADQIGIGGPNAARTYTQYVNSDFGFVRGFILSLDKRFSQGLSLSVDYTFQIAKGSASDPKDTRNSTVSAGGIAPEVQLSPLAWDQRHTLNTILSYSEETFGASVIGKYGSGLPYTPRLTSDVTVLLTNSGEKPSTVSIDLRMYKTVTFDFVKMMIFLRVTNLFDTPNEVGVYDDTGRAGKTYDEAAGYQTASKEYVNTIHDYFINPQNYSEPRRIEFGVTLDF